MMAKNVTDLISMETGFFSWCISIFEVNINKITLR